MAEKVKRICHERKVSKGEAPSYLEGFEWKLDEAMDACRSKTLPPFVVRVKSAPGVSVNEESAVEESSATPSEVNKLQILSQAASIQWEQQPRRSKEQLINSFLEVAVGRSIEDATSYLERYNWEVNNAVFAFLEMRHLGIDRSTNEGLNLGVSSMDDGTSSSQTYPPGFSGGYHSVIGNWNSQQLRSGIDPSTLSDRKIPPGRYKIVRSNLQGASTDESSMALTSESESMHGMSPSVPLPSPSQFEVLLDNIATSPSSMETSVKEVGNEHTVVDIPVMASSEVETEFIPDPTGRICDVHEVSRDAETLPPVEKVPARVEQRTTIMPPRVINSPQQQLPQLSDEDIASFCNVTGRNQNIAIYCLNLCNGNVEKAIGYCFDQGFPVDFLEDVTSKPTEESGDANVTLAITPMASFEKSEAVADEEDSSAEMVEPQAVPVTSATIEIRLADETTLKISLRSDQTVRDIRKAIEELRPDITRENYSLTSVADVDCSDLNIAVEKIASDGYATLIQMFID